MKRSKLLIIFYYTLFFITIEASFPQSFMKFADAHYSGFASEMFQNEYSKIPKSCVNELKEYFDVGGRVIGIVFTTPDYVGLKENINVDSSALAMYRFYEKMIHSNSCFLQKYNPNHLDTIKLNLFISIEGLNEGAIKNLLMIDTSHSIMVVGIIHNNSNEFGTSCYDNINRNEVGLTEKGKSIIEELIRKKIIIDVAHTSQKTFFDILKVCTENNGVIISSHTALYHMNENPRNLNNEQIKALENLRGGIGLMVHEPLIKSKFSNETTFESYYEMYVYLSEKLRFSNVFIGSDLCAEIKPIRGVQKLADLPRLIIEFCNQHGQDYSYFQDFAFNNLIKIFNSLY